MAKYTITHSCGHEQGVQLYGSYDDRLARQAWLRSQPCTACRGAAAAAEAKAAGLPALTGSPKQIAWAETIRAKAIAEAAEVARLAHPSEAGDVARALDALRAQTSARWWIDNRFAGAGAGWLRTAHKVLVR